MLGRRCSREKERESRPIMLGRTVAVGRKRERAHTIG
jgi:hypothetical protein